MNHRHTIIIPLLLLLAVLSQGQVTTVAGNGRSGTTADSFAATATKIGFVTGLCIDKGNNLYLADTTNATITMDSAGIVYKERVSLSISGICTDNNRNFYVASPNPNEIINVRMPYDSLPYLVIAAGSHFCDRYNNSASALAATLSHPAGVATDGRGNIYFSDEYNNQVFKTDAAGNIQVVAGTTTQYPAYPAGEHYYGCAKPDSGFFYGDSIMATDAVLYRPKGVAIDKYGNLYIADYGNNRVRKVDTNGMITTLAGFGTLGFTGDGGPAVAAKIVNPWGVATDTLGSVYFTEYGNSRIRKVSPSGIISTVAGVINGAGIASVGFNGDGLAPYLTTLNQPTGIQIDTFGDIIFADSYNYRVRKVCGITVAPITGLPISGAKLCITDTINLKDASPGGVWSCDSSAIASIDDTGHVTANTYGTVIFTYQIHPGCFSFLPVTFQSPPAAIAGNDYVCIDGDSVLYTDKVPGGVWLTNKTNASISSIGWLHGLVVSTDTILYAVNNACGKDTVSKVIQIIPLVHSGIITGPDSLCTGDSLVLRDTVVSGVWAASNATATVLNGKVMGLSGGIDTISFSVSNLCSSETSSMVITINPMPYAGQILCDSILCSSGTIILHDSISGGIWSGSNDRAIVSDSGLIYGLAPGLFVISYTLTNLCGTITTTKTVSFALQPQPGYIVGNNSVCAGASISLNATIAGGNWYVADTELARVDSGVVSGMLPGSTVVLYMISNLCGSVTDSFPISIDVFLPDATTGSVPDTLCQGAYIKLPFADSPAGWTSSTNIAAIDSSGILTAEYPGDDVLIYHINNACGDTSLYFPLLIQSLPLQPVITTPNVICLNNPPDSLTAIPPGGIWSGSSGHSTITGQTIQGFSVGSDTLYYTIQNLCGSSVQSLPVLVQSQPACDSMFGIRPVAAEYVVMPNPATDAFHVFLPYSGNGAHIRIEDILGRKAFDCAVGPYEHDVPIDANSFGRGIYLIMIDVQGVEMVRKLILY